MNEYFYLDSQNQQCGPVFPTQFSTLGITASTLVWCNGMENWMPAGSIPELATYLIPVSQPQPPQQPQPGTGYGQGYNNYGDPYMFPPQSYLVWAILTTVLCCLPLGIVSIVYSSQVDTEWSRGNREAAYRKSKLAKNWAIASAATSAGLLILYILFIVCLGIGASGFPY